MDRQGRVIVIKITFNESYPEDPPLVVSTPPIHDACFDNRGVLHFATKQGLFVWQRYKRYTNPLVYLADELAGHYKAI